MGGSFPQGPPFYVGMCLLAQRASRRFPTRQSGHRSELAALLGGSRGPWAGRQPVVSEVAAPARLAGLSFPGSLGQSDATGTVSALAAPTFDGFGHGTPLCWEPAPTFDGFGHEPLMWQTTGRCREAFYLHICCKDICRGQNLLLWIGSRLAS